MKLPDGRVVYDYAVSAELAMIISAETGEEAQEKAWDVIHQLVKDNHPFVTGSITMVERLEDGA